MSDLAAVDKAGMRLTEKQKRLADLWVEAKVARADFTYADLAQAAGYSGSKDTLYVAASRSLALPHVRAYLHSKAREHLMDGAVDVAITLRSLSTGAKSERVRADTAARLATGLRLIDGEQAERGPAVAIQVVFQHGGGARLAQLTGQAVEAQAIGHVQPVEHSLAEGEGGRTAPARRPKRTPPPGQAQAAEAPPGVKKPRARPPAGPSSPRAPKNPRGKNSGSGKSRGGSGG